MSIDDDWTNNYYISYINDRRVNYAHFIRYIYRLMMIEKIIIAMIVATTGKIFEHILVDTSYQETQHGHQENQKELQVRKLH